MINCEYLIQISSLQERFGLKHFLLPDYRISVKTHLRNDRPAQCENFSEVCMEVDDHSPIKRFFYFFYHKIIDKTA